MARNMEIIHAHNTMTRQRKLVRDMFIGKTTDTYWETQRTYCKHTGHREKRVDETVEVTK